MTDARKMDGATFVMPGGDVTVRLVTFVSEATTTGLGDAFTELAAAEGGVVADPGLQIYNPLGEKVNGVNVLEITTDTDPQDFVLLIKHNYELQFQDLWLETSGEWVMLVWGVDYTYAQGSTKLTFLANGLNKLKNGVNSIVAQFKDTTTGAVKTAGQTVTVTKKATLTPSNPPTSPGPGNNGSGSYYPQGPSPSPTGAITINVSVPASYGGGNASGGGSVGFGSTVTLRATPNKGYNFQGWYENGVLVSSDATYTFFAAMNRDIQARFGLYGDLTNDRKVNGADLLLMVRYFAVANVTVPNTKNADVNGDGKFNYDDLTKLKEYFARPGVTLG